MTFIRGSPFGRWHVSSHAPCFGVLTGAPALATLRRLLDCAIGATGAKAESTRPDDTGGPNLPPRSAASNMEPSLPGAIPSSHLYPAGSLHASPPDSSVLAVPSVSVQRATAASVSGEGTTAGCQRIGVDGAGRCMGAGTAAAGRGGGGAGAGAGNVGGGARGGGGHRSGAGASRRASRAARSSTSRRVSRSAE